MSRDILIQISIWNKFWEAIECPLFPRFLNLLKLNLRAVLAGAFSPVKGLVSPGDELVGVATLNWIHRGHTQAGCNPARHIFRAGFWMVRRVIVDFFKVQITIILGCDSLSYSFSYDIRTRHIGLSQNNGEFVTTIAANQVRRTLAAFDHGHSHLLQAFIASLVTVGIVEQLEIIQVANNKRDRLAGTVPTAPFIIQKFPEFTIIGYACHFISRRQELELLIGQTQLFGALGDEAFELALAVAGLTEPVTHKSIDCSEKHQDTQPIEPPGAPERRDDADRK